MRGTTFEGELCYTTIVSTLDKLVVEYNSEGQVPVSTRAHSRLLHPGKAHGAFKGSSSRRYDFLAKRLMRGVYRRIAEDISVAAPAGGAVLDVGAGPGVLLAELARSRPDLRLTAVDLSADMAAVARRNLGEFGERASVEVADVADLPFGDSAFDVVVTSFSLHHWDDVPAAVPEMARVIRPGGRLYIYDFQRAPFDAVDAAASEGGSFARQPPHHDMIRTGRWHLRRCVRHVLSA